MEDPVTSALVDGSTYDQIRVQRISTFKWPVRQKLFRLGGLSSATSALILSLALLPSGVVEFLPTDPYAALTRVVLTAAIAVAVMAVSGILLAVAGTARRRLEPMDEARAEAMLAFEEMWSLIGFVVAAHAGVDVLDGVYRLIGPMAYMSVPAPVPPSAVAVTALAVGMTFLVVSAVFPDDGQWTGS
ncbi:hypothetical protein BRD04_08845 [Halobacteriales archaeon QS_9_67_17]|nr:MAG: hypothetical protein BRD04_08845 [Halobacteriales archaeon QS_9_67_17]